MLLMDRGRFGLAAILLLGLTSGLFAVSPQPLENAYWRFEEGTVGTIVPATTPVDAGAVLDSINANHMRRYNDVNAPTYVADVPGPKVPATGQPNNLALWFNGSFQDIYTDGKHINNPITEGFTVEASFKAEVVGVDLWQAIVSKESTNDDLSSDSPPFALKITGDGNNVLRLEMRDKGNNLRVVDSFTPIVANKWYHAAVVATSSEVKLYLSENDAVGFVFQGSAPIAGGGPLWQGTVPADGYNTVWNIGKGMWARAIGDFFHGMIDEVRLSNRPLTPEEFLWYPLAIPGDFNQSGTVDIDDLMIFEACATGPGILYNAQALPTGCNVTGDLEGIIAPDFNGDGDVDAADFGVFQRCYAPGASPIPDCEK